MKELKEIKKAYFIGIGGIGMSAIARFFLGRGTEVHGYDKTETELTKALVAEGMKVHYEDNISFIPNDLDLVVYTPAIPKDHRELNWFIDNKFEVLKRSQVLGIISLGMKTIAVAGTHGKTTTSSLITHILRTAKIDCTAFLGGISVDLGSNFVQGKSKWVVVEADEYDRSFLQLRPDIATIMSLDPDHLDIYGNEKVFKYNFTLFTCKIKNRGVYFYKAGLKIPAFRGMWMTDEKAKEWNLGHIENHTFGIGKGNYKANKVRVENGHFMFDFKSEAEEIKDIKMSLPGKHNIENALAAIAVAIKVGISADPIKKALASFKGIKRRFEFIVKKDDFIYIDDYAHHPTELNSAIEAARALYPQKKLTVIFQPHLFSRTRDFQDGFAEALDKADEVLLMDIYPARELPMEGITSKIIFDKMQLRNKLLVTKENLMEVLKTKEFEVLMTMGAGDIDTFVPKIAESKK